MEVIITIVLIILLLGAVSALSEANSSCKRWQDCIDNINKNSQSKGKE